MALPFDEYTDLALEYSGVDVVLGANTVKGILERETDVAIDGLDVATEVGRISVAIKENSLPGLAKGAAITVDGVSYQVRRNEPHPRDHYYTRVHLAKV